jgi:hypothetical protein
MRVLLLALLLVAAASAEAQDSGDAPAVWPKVFTRGALGASGEFLSAREPNMPLWVSFRGDVDAVDVDVVRVPFDFAFLAAFNDHYNPRQVDYSFGFAPTLRVSGADVSLRYHHTSRHLHDAPRPAPVSWNLVGVALAGARGSDRLHWSGQIEASYYPPAWRRYVDYVWEAGGGARASYDVSRRWAYYADLTVRVLRCDPLVAGRSSVVGGRAEAGILLGYEAGRGAVFVAFDRRIDVGALSHDVQNIGLFGVHFVVAR